MASEPKIPDTQPQTKTGSVSAIPPASFYQRLPKSTENKPSKNIIPSTPPTSNSRVVPKSTPIVNKATNAQPYASVVKDRDDLNEDLAREMKGHFSGIMQPDLFLDTHLPLLPKSREPSQDELGTSLSAIPAALESGMYTPFIDAIKPHLKGMKIYDTHKNPDTERDNLSPDVSLYRKGTRIKKDRTYFPEISTFVEFKQSENADSFIDPLDMKNLPEDFIFERQEPALKKNRGQIASYSAAISGTQFRTHVFSVSICGTTARFILWDRSGAIVSSRFDYVQHPHLLVGFFYRYSRLRRDQQGYDLSVSEGPASPEELALLRQSGLVRRMKEANDAHKEFRKLMVPDRDDPSEEKEKPFLISYPPYYETRSPFSRATRAMLAFDLTTGKLVFLKDYWRAKIDDLEKEGEIYRILQEKNVPHIAPFGMGNDVRNHETITQRWNKWITPTSKQICLQHYRMTLNIVGRSLTAFQSSHQFISAIADAMEAHDGAYFDCQILHRDISVGNIIFTDENEGLLIDWDLCINLAKVKVPSVARRPARTGTWQFISALLLQDLTKSHTFQDDRESAFYVLLWLALRYTKTTPLPDSTHDLGNILRAFDERFIEKSGKIKGGTLKDRFFYRNIISRSIQFDGRPELDELIRELVSVLKVRYIEVPDDAEIEDAQVALQAIATAEGDVGLMRRLLGRNRALDYLGLKEDLAKRGWLVDTLRKHLDLGEWPNDGAIAQNFIPDTGNKRKADKDLATLDSRATKKHSSSFRSSNT